jgi:hypothetical protein
VSSGSWLPPDEAFHVTVAIQTTDRVTTAFGGSRSAARGGRYRPTVEQCLSLRKVPRDCPIAVVLGMAGTIALAVTYLTALAGTGAEAADTRCWP